MKLLKIKKIEKKDVPLYYRNEYSAISDFILIGDKTTEIALNFSIEMLPTGEKIIDIKFANPVDYPILPLLKVLKAEIEILEKKGNLL